MCRFLVAFGAMATIGLGSSHNGFLLDEKCNPHDYRYSADQGPRFHKKGLQTLADGER
jgi:hypothetical protein